MTKNIKTLYPTSLRIARIHFLYVLVFAASIIIFDASALIAPEAVMNRWKYTIGVLVATTGVWYFARAQKNNMRIQKSIVALLVLADIIFASLLVYADRGMASLAVILYTIPIVTISALRSRSAILATASLSVAAYAFVTIKYFVDFFNEGYKVQLYSSIGLYGAILFILALLLVAINKQESN